MLELITPISLAVAVSDAVRLPAEDIHRMYHGSRIWSPLLAATRVRISRGTRPCVDICNRGSWLSRLIMRAD
jgi:hypothetical protein